MPSKNIERRLIEFSSIWQDPQLSSDARALQEPVFSVECRPFRFDNCLARPAAQERRHGLARTSRFVEMSCLLEKSTYNFERRPSRFFMQFEVQSFQYEALDCRPFRVCSTHSKASCCSLCPWLRPPSTPGRGGCYPRNLEETWNVGPSGFS